MTSARTFSFIVVLAVLVAANSVLRADIITLRDGSVQEGEVVKDNADQVTLRVRIGANSGTVVIPRREVVSIQSKAMPPDRVLIDGVTAQFTLAERMRRVAAQLHRLLSRTAAFHGDLPAAAVRAIVMARATDNP